MAKCISFLSPYAFSDTQKLKAENMCLTPSRLSDGTFVACRGCRLCRDNRINDLVGRCLAEADFSSSVFAVTLTYAGDTPNSAILAYSDFQKFLKRLRKDGYLVRYIVAGEYGTKKGRAHWHCILFFRGKAPQVPTDDRINWSFWPHGYSYFQSPDYRGFRYVLKYALKDDDAQGFVKSLAMSKKPPLGYDFFMRMASDMVEQSLSIRSPEYSFKAVRDKHGKPRRYWLQGRMREMFLEEYCALWEEVWGCEPPQTDFLLETYLDKIAAREIKNDPSALVATIEAKRPKRVYIEPIDDDFDPIRQETGYLTLDERSRSGAVLVSYSDDTFSFSNKDGMEWHAKIDNQEIVGRRLLNSGLTRSNVTRACRWLRQKRENNRKRVLSRSM